MFHIREACLIYSDKICVIWDATFSFWEFIATVVASGLVTFLTIYWSIRASREATKQQLTAAQDAARLEREERLAAAAAERDQRSLETRTRLAQAMIRVVHQLEASVDSKPQSVGRRAANAEWAALRVALETSAEPNAAELYEFAAMTISRAKERHTKPNTESQTASEFVLDVIRKQFGNELAALARRWVADPASHPDPKTLQELREKWRAEEKLKHDQFMKTMQNILARPLAPEEAHVLGDDHADSASE